MGRIITVKGVGDVSAKPDYITLSMSIQTVSRKYDAAMDEAARRIEALRSAAERAGLEKDDLKTAYFHIDTHSETVSDKKGNYRQTFAGYECVYRLKLSFDFDSALLVRVLSAFSECGAAPELNIAFTVKNPDAVREELLTATAENARAKAETLCRASGAKLGQLVRIDYNWAGLEIASRTSFRVEDGIQPLMAASSAAPEITPEDIRLHDTAVFEWEIE